MNSPAGDGAPTREGLLRPQTSGEAKSTATSGKAPPPSISVIVPAYNQAKNLKSVLGALLEAAQPGVEILVVDDGSTDQTVAIAEAMGVRVLQCTSNLGPAGARNLGARCCRGEIVFFVDADVVVDSGAVSRVLTTFRERPDVAAVFGSYDDEPSAPSLISQYRNLLHHFVHQRGATEASTFWTGCGAVRRLAFEAVGGFDERRDLNYIEDVELGYRLRRAGYRILLDKQLQGKHLKRWDLISMIKTDLLKRALPWSRFLLANDTFRGDLNLAWQHRWSVALTGLGGAAVAAAAVQPRALLAAAAAFVGVAALNASFFSFLSRKRGPLFAAACFPLHLIHYCCGGLGFGYTWGEARLGRLSWRPASKGQTSPLNSGP